MKTSLMMAAAVALCMTAPALAKGKDDVHNVDKKTDYYFGKMDTNSDGKITREEHNAYASSKFRDADSNGDGAVSKEELRAEKMKDMKDRQAAIGNPASASPASGSRESNY